jgi:ATP-dependent RNA helicase DDX49/DBP8
MRQRERIENLNKFKASLNRILISTDLASRGLDIPIVDLIINFDLPRNPNDYIHRVGRTARIGKKGFCLNFVSQYDIDLILSIEKKINATIQEIFIDDDDIMSEISLVSQAVKICKMKIYESGFEEKNKKKKNYQKHGIIHPKDRNNKKKLRDEE